MNKKNELIVVIAQAKEENRSECIGHDDRVLRVDPVISQCELRSSSFNDVSNVITKYLALAIFHFFPSALTGLQLRRGEEPSRKKQCMNKIEAFKVSCLLFDNSIEFNQRSSKQT